MRALFVILLIAGVALVTVGAVVPELFVLSLVGLLVLVGTATAALAPSHHGRPPPHAYF